MWLSQLTNKRTSNHPDAAQLCLFARVNLLFASSVAPRASILEIRRQGEGYPQNHSLRLAQYVCANFVENSSRDTSARYQACALNFNFYLKKLHGGKFGLDHNLALSLQFAELDYAQAQVIKDKEDIIPPNVMSYIAAFDARLSNQEIESERFAYRLLFTRVTAKRHGQADRVIEFIDPNSEMAKNISKDYWVKEETEKPKLSAKQVVRKVREAVRRFRNASAHTILEEA